MSKNVTIVVSTNTHPATLHIGKYFLDLRDTTHDPNLITAHQMTTRVADHGAAVKFIGQVRDEARRHDVKVTVKDNTGELKL